jgi:hypothetical protein
MKKAESTLFPFGILMAAVLTIVLAGCFNPTASTLPGQEVSANSGERRNSDPYTVTVYLGGDQSGADRSVVGPDKARIKLTGIRNYIQLIVIDNNGEIAGVAEARKADEANDQAVLEVNSLPLDRTYHVLLLEGHWNYTLTGTEYAYIEDQPPTLLAAGLENGIVLQPSGVTVVTITLYPLVVDTVFSTTATPVEKIEPALRAGPAPLPAVSGDNVWNVTWTVEDGNGGNGFDRLLEAQNLAGSTVTGIAWYETLTTVPVEAALSGEDPVINDNTITQTLNTAAGEGSVNFNLEYVPFSLTTAPSGLMTPNWIIRNGLNDEAQDEETNFEAFGTASAGANVNGNGAVCFKAVTGSLPEAEALTISGDYSSQGYFSTAYIKFTTAGYEGDAAVYYAVAAKPTAGETAEPSYPSGYTLLGSYPASPVEETHQYRGKISLAGLDKGDYTVYLILYKDGEVSKPGTIDITIGPFGSIEVSSTFDTGIFVAVGGSSSTEPNSGSAIAYSYDGGETWEAGTLPDILSGTDVFLKDVAYGVVSGTGMFVALGSYNPSETSSNIALYSIDSGKTWEAGTLPTDYSSVAYGNGMFVACGNGIAYSSDGVNWSQSTPTPADSIYFNDITYGNGMFVALGEDTSTANAMSSSDGITWTPSVILDPNCIWHTVTYGGGTFLAFGSTTTTTGDETTSQPKAAYSTDGNTWIEASLPPDVTWVNAAAYGNNRFIAFGGSNTAVPTNSGNIYFSDDGISWTTESPVGGWIGDVSFGGGRLVAVGDLGPTYSTDDGSTWHEPKSSVSVLGNWSKVAYGGR